MSRRGAELEPPSDLPDPRRLKAPSPVSFDGTALYEIPRKNTARLRWQETLLQDGLPRSGEKLAVARLQREVTRSKSEGTMREKLMQELEEERGLRLQSERRLREVAEESELGRAQMLSLQQHFSRMEETVRSLLQNQGALEHTPLDTVDLMKAYKDKLSEEVKKQREGLERSGPPARGGAAERG
ncbi:hypothetical protein ANANG_G00277710 [Anguilla anguilla]|uniref:Uncharacterized protein n=1 Tax=Anguilla anguilla TaxID=7936 RepID=A0A9D3RK89_ANGAN|nr:hypothetical protein ANANG_G00277710 [Anguilla anguilla]